MTPNDVLAILVECWWNNSGLTYDQAGRLADALDDAGRHAEADHLRMHGETLAINTGLHDQWYIELHRNMHPRLQDECISITIED